MLKTISMCGVLAVLSIGAIDMVGADNLDGVNLDGGRLNAGGPAKLFDRLDADRDGAVVKDEVGENQQGLFERLLRTSDVNNDGRLDRDEFVTGTTNPPPATTAAGRRDGFSNRRGPAEVFQRFDKDADGILMLDEVPERIQKRFQQADADANGEVTKAEFTEQFERHMKNFKARQLPNQSNKKQRQHRATQGQGQQAIMRALDTDHDGALSAAELAAATSSLNSLDQDQDGALSQKELSRHSLQVHGRPAGQGGPAERIRQRILKSDTDGDGKISLDEAPERLQNHFDRADADRDGLLDATEVDAVVERIASHRIQGGKKKRQTETE